MIFFSTNFTVAKSFQNNELREIVKTYKNNEFRFEKKYKNKTVKLNAKFEKIVKALLRIPGITTTWNLIASTSDNIDIGCPLQDEVVEKLFDANQGDKILMSDSVSTAGFSVK